MSNSDVRPTPGYHAIHQRLARKRGRASDQTCECGAPASQWSWRREAGTGLILQGTSGGCRVTYGTDIETYDALCRVCHRARDPKPWSLRLRESAA